MPRSRARDRAAAEDPLEREIEIALQPGDLISWRTGDDFVAGLEAVGGRIGAVVAVDPARALRLCEAFLAGCTAKADEVDDSGASFAMFVRELHGRWIRARLAR